VASAYSVAASTDSTRISKVTWFQNSSKDLQVPKLEEFLEVKKKNGIPHSRVAGNPHEHPKFDQQF